MELPKHIVISRKGFDGGTGHVPSPIFPDDTMLSLPIPDAAGTVCYADLFGYLRVGEVVRLACDPVPAWAVDHPHLHGSARKKDRGNTLFVAEDQLELPGAKGLPGAAAFPRFKDSLRLSAPGMTRSWWRLPKWFHPRPGTPALSSHEAPDRWRLEDDGCLLRSVARGQEFVLDVEHYPRALEWAVDLIRNGLR